jgi:hypothetical protein
VGASTRGTDPKSNLKKSPAGRRLAPGGSPTETISESSRALSHLVRPAARSLKKGRTQPRLARMDSLVSLLLSKEAAASSIAIVAAIIFVIAWRLWGRD